MRACKELGGMWTVGPGGYDTTLSCVLHFLSLLFVAVIRKTHGRLSQVTAAQCANECNQCLLTRCFYSRYDEMSMRIDSRLGARVTSVHVNACMSTRTEE